MLAAVGKTKVPMTFVSPYYKKEVVLNTRCGELRGWRAISDFTMAVHDSNSQCSPDPNKWVEARGHRKSRRIRNDMDASEASDKRPATIGTHHGSFRIFLTVE